MTQRTRNHAHWSEGSWHSPIIAPHEELDDLFANEAIVSDINDPPLEDYKPNGIVEAIGGVFHTVVDTIGKILGGAADLAIGIFGGLVENVNSFVGGIVNGIGKAIDSVFSGGLWGDPDVPPEPPALFSPIKANFEKMLGPHFERIDQAQSEIATLEGESQQIRDALNGKIQGQFSLIDDLQLLNDDIEQKIEIGIQESATLDGLIAEMEDMVGASQEAILEDMAELSGSIDGRVTTLINTNSKINTISQDLGKKVDAQSSSYKELVALNTNFDSKVNTVPEVVAVIKEAKRINDNLWGSQGELNQLNTLLWGAQGEANEENIAQWQSQGLLNKLQEEMWSEQGEINELNKVLWGQQGVINKAHDEKWVDQGLANSLQTEMWAEQGEINQMILDLSDKSAAISAQGNDISKQLAEINKLKMEMIPRHIFLETGKMPFNEHIAALEVGDYWHIEALGTWVGEIIFSGAVWVADNRWNPELQMRVVKSSRKEDRTYNTVVGKGRNVLLTYFVRPGTPGLHDKSTSTYNPPRENYWETVSALTMDVTDTVGHALFYEVGWDAASRGKQYGARIVRKRSGTSDFEIVSTGLRNNLGPTSFLGDGFATQTLTFSNVELKANDQLLFQVRSSGNVSQRRVRHTKARVNWIKAPTTTGL